MAIPDRLFVGQVTVIVLLAMMVGFTVLAAVLELAVSILVFSLLPALGLLGYLFRATIVQKQVSFSLVSAVLVSIAGSMLVVFQPYKSVVELFHPTYLQTVQYLFLGLFCLFLGTSLYMAWRASETPTLVYAPYVVMILTVVAAIDLTEQIWLETYPAGTGITGIGWGWSPNFCTLESPLSLFCHLCTVTSGDIGAAGCYYDALAIIGVLTAGIVTGFLFSKGMGRYRQILVTVLSGIIGTGLTVYFGL